MNEGIGSSIILVIITIFIALVSAYLAFNVNYTKAFRMKNKIIELYERYDGNCNSTGENSCYKAIEDYAAEIGYNTSIDKCPSDYSDSSVPLGKNGEYCVKKVKANSVSGSGNKYDVIDDKGEYYYYKVLTRIDIKIPLVDNILGTKVFSITGDTKVIEAK